MLTFNFTTSQQFRDKYAINGVNMLKGPKNLTNPSCENHHPLLSNISNEGFGHQLKDLI